MDVDHFIRLRAFEWLAECIFGTPMCNAAETPLQMKMLP
jgi:hypothetical protein